MSDLLPSSPQVSRRGFPWAALLALVFLGLGGACALPRPALQTGFAFSRDVPLNREEEAVDAMLRRQRGDLLARFAPRPDLPFTRSFTEWREEMGQDNLHQSLLKMPKGGMLHLHGTATGDAAWIVERALATAECHVYWGQPGVGAERGQLAFFNGKPAPEGWVPMPRLKATRPNLRAELLALYTFGPEDGMASDPWRKFRIIFQRLDAFTSYRPVFLDYYRHAFELLARDQVQFVELRTFVDPIATEDGGRIEGDGVLELFRSILAQVRQSYPDFDLRIIVCGFRFDTPEGVRARLDRTRRWLATAPDLVAGFDLVGNEVGGHSNGYYAEVLGAQPQVPLFLHGGESLSPANPSVKEAFQLGARRIGHGFNLVHFPELQPSFREAGVLLEVCPISNQLLGYFPDLRRHPARDFLRQGLQAVLSSDDPAIFQSRGLTDDFWMATLAWDLDLRSLKQLALNSIHRSSLDAQIRQRHLELFHRRWERFIQDLAAAPAKATTGPETPVRGRIGGLPERNARPRGQPPVSGGPGGSRVHGRPVLVQGFLRRNRITRSKSSSSQSGPTPVAGSR